MKTLPLRRGFYEVAELFALCQKAGATGALRRVPTAVVAGFQYDPT